MFILYSNGSLFIKHKKGSKTLYRGKREKGN
nr:MAG TPA: hypothetical protein [Caudoviricetes sp.]